MKALDRFLFAVLLAMLVCGCAGSSKYMKEIPEADASYVPDAGHALVIFMRPSGLGFAVSSSVFDITTEENKLVGIVPAKKKVAYRTEPGEKMFMVIGESADFMRADLIGGKTYYALVSPRVGAWKARFSLKPVRKGDLGTGKFSEWTKSCVYNENTKASYGWAEQNAPSINSKRDKYMKKWLEKPEEARPFLKPEDGQ
jgi:hypothetical protein